MIEYASHNILYAWGNDTNVVDNPMAIILNLCVDTLQQVEGFNNYAMNAVPSGTQPRARGYLLSVATITALMVCIRFSAWSKTTLAADSNTSSVTSMPPCRP